MWLKYCLKYTCQFCSDLQQILVMKDNKTIKRFTGKLFWIWPNINSIQSGAKPENWQCADIKRAIINDKDFTLEWVSRDIQPGQLKLHTDDYINYYGFSSYLDADNFAGKINCIYYENSNGAILIGTEIENGNFSTLLVKLEKVEKFEN